MMLPYFPEIYPGELLYSVLGRLKCHTGTLSPKGLLIDIFGSRNVRAGVFLQTNLGRLAANIPPSRGLSARRLALETSLLPYFTAYQPQEIRDWALAALSGDNVDSDAVHVRLGLAASNVRLPSVLRYCSVCRTEMLQKPRELYWRRDHQLPGVLVCPIHGTPLSDSVVEVAHVEPNEFIAPDLDNCSANPALPIWARHAKTVRLLQEIAQASASLLSAPPESRALQSWGEEIQLSLKARGFGRGNAYIDQVALREAYLAHFAPIMDILPDAMPGDWLEDITRKHRKAFSPLHHVLIWLLIEIHSTVSTGNPFGPGPWPCRNPLVEHFGQPVITNCKLHEEGGKIIGVFRCSCGYAFSTAPEPASRTRILDFGPLFKARLCELVEAGSSLRGAARELHVDSNTVLRYVSLFGLNTSWKARPARPKLPRIERETMRAAWTGGHVASPNLTRRQLCRKLPAVYAWLYRNDHDWLNVQPPLGIIPISNKPRLDWPAIDAATAETLRLESARLRAQNPPQQITRLGIERFLGQRGWLEKRLHKLPQCVAVLAELTESVEDFQFRRVIWATGSCRTGDFQFKYGGYVDWPACQTNAPRRSKIS